MHSSASCWPVLSLSVVGAIELLWMATVPLGRRWSRLLCGAAWIRPYHLRPDRFEPLFPERGVRTITPRRYLERDGPDQPDDLNCLIGSHLWKQRSVP